MKKPTSLLERLVALKISEEDKISHLTTETALVVDVLDDLGSVVAVLLLVLPDAHLVGRLRVPSHRRQRYRLPAQTISHFCLG